jgi:hypothetical protein
MMDAMSRLVLHFKPRQEATDMLASYLEEFNWCPSFELNYAVQIEVVADIVMERQKRFALQHDFEDEMRLLAEHEEALAYWVDDDAFDII